MFQMNPDLLSAKELRNIISIMEIVSELYKKEKKPQYIQDAFRFSEKSKSRLC